MESRVDRSKGVLAGRARRGGRVAGPGTDLVVGGGGERGGIVRVDELDGDAERRQDVLELRVRAAVEVARGDDVIADLREVDDRIENRVRAGRDAEAAELRDAVLEDRHALFEHVDGRVHQARVDVAELGEREELRRLLGRLELVRRGAVDRDRARRRRRVGRPTAMDADGLWLELPVRAPLRHHRRRQAAHRRARRSVEEGRGRADAQRQRHYDTCHRHVNLSPLIAPCLEDRDIDAHAISVLFFCHINDGGAANQA